ncbi:MAG: peptidylprolyl isomerase [Clostridia bacterium]|nr:peptidylprolyl isomerase [Clostridia bacterium]
MITKKLISLLLLAVMLTSLLISCNGNTREVMELDGHSVTYEVYRYVCVNSRRDIEAELGEDVWTSDKADEAKATLEDNIKKSLATLYSVCSLGRDYGIEWDDSSIEAAVKIERNELVDEYGSEDEFKAALEEAAMSDGAFNFIKSNEILIDEVYMKIAYADEKNSDEAYLKELFMGDSFIRVKQILVGGENAGTDEENLEIIKGIKAKLDAGEDFDTLCREYNNDLYMFNNDIGYYITRGTRDLAFEDAAFSLEIGEVSDIVKTASGYSLIKRYEKDESYIDENIASLTDEYFEALYTAAFEKKYDSITSSMPELPDDIDIVEIK